MGLLTAAASQQQPTQLQSASQARLSQLASLASQPDSQASQPANVASGHRSLRPPGLDVSKLFYRGIQSVLIRRHRRPQAAKLSGTHSTRGAGTHTKNQSNIDDMANFPANRVMGRLWHDHFRDLGYPTKFYRVQHAIFIAGASM